MIFLEDFVDSFRTILPFSVFIIYPLLIIISPINPVEAAHEFSVFRMQQFDMQGNKYGSRSTVFNFEARPIGSKLLTRKCLVLRLLEVSAGAVREAAAQNLGGVLILLPRDPDEKERQHLLSIERDLLSEEIPMAVYLAYETPELLAMHTEVQRSLDTDSASSAAAALFGAIWSTGFQLYTAAPSAAALTDREVVNLHGRLVGAGLEENLPTVVLVAHYDSFGLAPGMAIGADSNAAGVTVLLELARLFSRMYTSTRTHAKYNLVFLLSGAGKFNYMGTRKWIDDHLDGTESSLLSDVSLVICLDGLAGPSHSDLFMHVSKPPKDGSPGALFLRHLQQVAQGQQNRSVKLEHKKINLADELLAWEHERFSIRRLPGLSLSRFSSHLEPLRRSVLDTKMDEDAVNSVAANSELIGEAMTRFLFNVSDLSSEHAVLGDKWISKNSLAANIDLLTRQARPAQLLRRGHPVLVALESAMSHHLQDVKVTGARPDRRDPELLLYDGLETTMSAHNVKPAVFDLFLACAIGLYLGGIYLLVQNFHHISAIMATTVITKKKKVI